MKLNQPEVAVFGGGCFWCTQAIYERVRGVTQITTGYVNGTEVIRLEFDPKLISYEQLLEIFWHTHDPTSLDRQGADVGPQYRSVIFTTSAQQTESAQVSKTVLEHTGELDQPIVTQILPLPQFSPADAHHQHYYEHNQQNIYCHLVINPKLQQLQEKYPHLLKEPS